MSFEILKYSILPWIGVMCCAYVLKKVRPAGKGHSYLLFVNLSCMCLAQAIGYSIAPVLPGIVSIFADAYLIGAYFLFSHLAIFATRLSTDRGGPYINLYYIPALIFTSLHLSGLMVDGYELTHNSLLHKDGPLAPAFDLFALMSCFWVCIRAKLNIRSLEDRMLITKNMLLMISFIPLALAFLVLIGFSMTNTVIPATYISPAIMIYTALTYAYLTKNEVMDLTIGFKFFRERLRIAHKVLASASDKAAHNLLKSELEKQFIIENLAECHFHIGNAAKAIGWHHSTLRTKMTEYNIKIDHEES